MKNTIVKDAAILFVITLIAGLALGAVHAITLEPINQATIAATNKTYSEVYPEASEFENTDELTAAVEQANTEIDTWGIGNKAGKLSINDAMVAKDASGNIEGVKTGNANDQQFNAISGATFTSTAVSYALNAALHFVNNCIQ